MNRKHFSIKSHVSGIFFSLLKIDKVCAVSVSVHCSAPNQTEPTRTEEMALTTSSCFEDEKGNGVEFTAEISQARSANQAKQLCFDIGLQPAQFTDETLTLAVTGFISEEVPIFDPNVEAAPGFWLGLERDIGLDPRDPRSFKYIDGTEIADFALTPQQNPWFQSSPGIIALEDERSCVLALYGQGVPIAPWFDQRCDEEDRPNTFTLCQASCELPEEQPGVPVEEANTGADVGTIIGSVLAAIGLIAVFSLVVYYLVQQKKKTKKTDTSL